ncbi:MAG TPA: PIN domain-containing protein [Burkholderiaceae bacterium]|nr:PIN domain-containing protein [Burkholderiaceae bacterium]
MYVVELTYLKPLDAIEVHLEARHRLYPEMRCHPAGYFDRVARCGTASLNKLATADAVVYATARHLRAELLTCDAHFEKLPGVALHAK